MKNLLELKARVKMGVYSMQVGCFMRFMMLVGCYAEEGGEVKISSPRIPDYFVTSIYSKQLQGCFKFEIFTIKYDSSP